MLRALLPCAFVSALFFVPAPSSNAQDPTQVPLEIVEVTDSISMIMGMGGNVAVYHGDDGVFLVDDQFEQTAEMLLAKVAEVSDGPLRFVVNTHWHWDHAGGNAAAAADGAVIVAHENVRTRMSSDHVMPSFNRTIPAAPESARPVVTYADGVSFHWNGGRVDLTHVDPAHTDTDTLVHFVDENVLHTGDLFFMGTFPFIDLSSGGDIDGVIAGVAKALTLADDDTKIIPGHGPLGTKADLQAFHAMLVDARARILSRLEGGFTVEEVQRFNPLGDYDEAYGQGWLKTETFTGFVAASLKRKLDAQADEADD